MVEQHLQAFALGTPFSTRQFFQAFLVGPLGSGLLRNKMVLTCPSLSVLEVPATATYNFGARDPHLVDWIQQPGLEPSPHTNSLGRM